MSVRFDNTSDRITCAGSNPPDPASGFTVAGWAYISVDTNNNATMCRLYAASTTANLATDTDGTSGPAYFTGGGEVHNTLNMAVGQWRKVAMSCTGTTGKVYAAAPGGATTVNSGTVAGAASPTGITLGGRDASDATEAFDGRLAYWRVWAVELTQAEIEAEWLADEAVRTAGLWADWPLETHTDLTDHSGNGHHLIAGATSTTTEDGPPLGVTGTLAATLPALTASMSGGVSVSGALDASLPALAAVVAGSSTVSATLAATLPALRASFIQADLSAPWHITAGPPVVTVPYAASAPTVSTLYTADSPTVF